MNNAYAATNAGAAKAGYVSPAFGFSPIGASMLLVPMMMFYILWLWAPIYGNILSVELFQPLWATLGDPAGATWFATKTGIFVVCLITIALAGILVSIGMAGYARIQKWCFYLGLVGFTVIVVLLLVKSHTSFV